jgi:hypothetical protein
MKLAITISFGETTQPGFLTYNQAMRWLIDPHSRRDDEGWLTWRLRCLRVWFWGLG